MATIVIPWATGTGDITLTYTGQGNGSITVSSDENNLDVVRSQDVTVRAANSNIYRTLTINQAAGPNFRLSDGKAFIPVGSDYFNVKESV